jgi:uncharacterized protein YqeY
MASSLKQRILEDVKTAMRARDKERLGTLRLVTAAIKQKEVDSRVDLDDQAVVTVLEKMLKQRRDSHTQYSEAGRRDLADQEHFEIRVIEAYMPEALGAEELEALIDAAIGETGAGSMRDMGKVMGLLKPRVQGRADLGAVSARVKERLADSGAG